MTQKLEYTVLDMIESATRSMKANPLNLGGVGGMGGGLGGPPGGFIGQLPQYRVAYDTLEAATLATLPSGVAGISGWSLVDNLNHIRYRLGALETGSGLTVSGGSITVVDDNTSNTYPNTDTIHFSGGGITVVDLGGGDVRVIVTASGGGGTPLVVQEQDGSPIVSNVDKIIFSGAVVTDLGSGDVLVQIATASGGGSPLTVMEYDTTPTVSGVDKIIFSGVYLEDLGSGDVLVPIENAVPTEPVEASVFLHKDTALIFEDTNADESNFNLWGDIGVGAIPGYLRSWMQANGNPTELITNGTFEGNSLTGWTLTGSPSVVSPGWESQYCVRCSDVDTIKQTITVVSGDYYLLRFASRKDGASDSAGYVLITNGDQAAYNPGGEHANKWLRGAALIRATSTSLTLEFATSLANNVYFDSISLKHISAGFGYLSLDSDGIFALQASNTSTPMKINGRDALPTVMDFDSIPTVANVDKIIFSGFAVSDLGNGDVMVSMSGFVPGHIIQVEDTPFTQRRNLNFTGDVTGSDDSISNTTVIGIPGLRVREQDGSPSIFPVHIITFSGAVLTNPTSDEVLVQITASGTLGTGSWFTDQTGGTSDTYGVLAGSVNGSNTVFTVSQAKYVSASLRVYLNGQLQTQGSAEDWVETSPAAGTFTFNTAPQTGDQITAVYQFISATFGNADTVDGLHASSFATFNDAEGDPSNTSTTASDGTSIYAARRDHVHNHFPADFINAATAEDPLDGDYFGYRKTSGGTYRKILWSGIKSILKTYFDTIYENATGWQSITSTWTRTGNHTFTVSGDVTATYRKGAKVRYKDGGAYEYGVILSSSYGAPNTTVTLITNTDYTMAAATITDTYISYIENPEGFPTAFNFSPSFTNVSVGNGTLSAIWSVQQGLIKGKISLTYAGASPTTSITGMISITAPATPATAYTTYETVGAAALVDNGVALYMGECVMSNGGIEVRCINAAGTYAVWTATSGTVPFTWAASDKFTMDFSYLL
jgi:hypothetical protein